MPWRVLFPKGVPALWARTSSASSYAGSSRNSKSVTMPDFQFERRLADIQRFYKILDELEVRVGGKRTLATADGLMDWPKRGVYFFFAF